MAFLKRVNAALIGFVLFFFDCVSIIFVSAVSSGFISWLVLVIAKLLCFAAENVICE